MYETSGVIDESFFQLIKYDIIPKKIKKIIEVVYKGGLE